MTAYRFEPRRELGRTGFKATQLGLGDLADRQVPLESCVATMLRGFESGLNVADTAPGYEDGYSETIVGRAVREWCGASAEKRSRLFVIDKVDHPEQPVAPQVEASLARLGLPAVDLFVFHGVSKLETWKQLAAAGGGMEQLGECARRGLARRRGISSHHPAVLRAALRSGLCDVVLFPVGPFVDARFLRETLPLARRLGVGTVCFKTFGAGKLVGDTTGYNRPLQARPRGKISSGGEAGRPVLPHLSAAECLAFTLSYDPDVALLGLSFPNEQDEAFAAAAAFTKPLSPRELAALRRRAVRAVAGKGPCWWNPKP